MKKIMTICSALVALSFTVFISVSKAEDFGFGKNIPRASAPGVDPNEALNRAEDPNDPLFTQANPAVTGISCNDCLKNTFQDRLDGHTNPPVNGSSKGTSEPKSSPGSNPDGTR